MKKIYQVPQTGYDMLTMNMYVLQTISGKGPGFGEGGGSGMGE